MQRCLPLLPRPLSQRERGESVRPAAGGCFSFNCLLGLNSQNDFWTDGLMFLRACFCMIALWLVSLPVAAGVGQFSAVGMQAVEASVQLPEVKAVTDGHHCAHQCSLCMAAFFSCGDGGCGGAALNVAADLSTEFIVSGEMPEVFAYSFQSSIFPPPGKPPRILA